MLHYIYKITLLCGSLKDHYYIGKHSTKNPKQKYYGSGKILRDYYKKYGKKAGVTFLKEILEYNSTEEENFERERIILSDLWEKDPMCINLCAGGRGPTGHKVTDAAKKKMSYWGGKNMSEESNKKRSETMRGIPHNKEHNKHVSEALKGRVCYWREREVDQYSPEGQFIKRWKTIKEAKKIASSISHALSGKQKTAGGFIWKYAS